MRERSIIQGKSYKFSIRIIKLYQFLKTEKREFVLANQILRCGTSIGANVDEASGGQSKRDFLHKLTIAYKEARETSYWLRLLKDTEFINEKMFESLKLDCDEILKIITKIQITVKNNLKKQLVTRNK
ncbi:MAG: four helix bundle protein [Bacteroidetes bacterium]|nr:four helix bundle protein [Bacteroidota bacterium]